MENNNKFVPYRNINSEYLNRLDESYIKDIYNRSLVIIEYSKMMDFYKKCCDDNNLEKYFKIYGEKIITKDDMDLLYDEISSIIEAERLKR